MKRLPIHYAACNARTLWSFQRVTRSYRMRCYARGCYTFGSVTLISSDPLGWFERKVVLPLKETLLVYPLIAPPEAFGLSALHPFGEENASRRLLEDPMGVLGVRNYQLGDDPRRIHWKATAHAGSLRSKIYEYSSQQRLLLLLDAGKADTPWASTDSEMQEFCIAAAASLAVWALDQGYMVGLLANCAVMLTSSDERDAANQMTTPSQNGTQEEPRTLVVSAPGVSIPYSCGHGQYQHLLALLARLVPHENVPMEDVIDRGDALFATGTTAVLVSPFSTLTQATIERLRMMRTLGIAIQLVLADDLKEKTTVETHDIPVHVLGGREKWHELGVNPCYQTTT